MNRQDNESKKKFGFLSILLITCGVYMALVVAFYFLAGEALYFRPSRGNLAMPADEDVTVELVQDAAVEQYFTCSIQRLESVSLLWGNYGRANSGTLTVELARVPDEVYNHISGRAEPAGVEAPAETLLIRRQFDVSALEEHGIIVLQADEPIETVCDAPLVLRLYADSEAGNGGTPIRCLTTQSDNAFLVLNGERVEGTLCFTAEGTDYIWTGKHYWQLAAGLGLALVLAALLIKLRAGRGGHSYILNAVTAVEKYRFLIRQLVSRDFKTKYKRSVLGVFWSFLNPLLMMLVQYFVFSTIFKSNIPYFAAYLITGTVMFNFLSESVGMALTSIVGNANLITKVYMPKYIYPLTRVLSSLVNLAISLVPMLIVCLITGVHFHKSVILAIFFIFCLVVFCLGMGLLLSTSMVFFRDTQFLWGVLNMMWMYATPIFYPESILPAGFRAVLDYNPMYVFIKGIRICILDGVSPEPMMFFKGLVMALVTLLVGALVFRKNQDKFVLYL